MAANAVLRTPFEETLSNSAMEEAITLGVPGRFNAAMQAKIARNAGASWTHAGYLRGRRKKVRVRPTITPATVADALALGYPACSLTKNRRRDVSKVDDLCRNYERFVSLPWPDHLAGLATSGSFTI